MTTTSVIVLACLLPIIFLVYYFTKKRKNYIAKFRENLQIGYLAKIYLYGESSLWDDGWYYVKIIGRRYKDDAFRLQYKAEGYPYTAMPLWVDRCKLFPISKREYKRLKDLWNPKFVKNVKE